MSSNWLSHPKTRRHNIGKSALLIGVAIIIAHAPIMSQTIDPWSACSLIGRSDFDNMTLLDTCPAGRSNGFGCYANACQAYVGIAPGTFAICAGCGTGNPIPPSLPGDCGCNQGIFPQTFTVRTLWGSCSNDQGPCYCDYSGSENLPPKYTTFTACTNPQQSWSGQ